VAANRDLIERVRASLRDAADNSKAPGMQAYMKSAMPYMGVMAGPQRKVTRSAYKVHPLATFEDWRDTALALWREATYREERYAAQDLVAYPAYAKFQTPAAMAMYEEFIVDGAWWDHVDAIATHQVGSLLLRYRDEIEPVMRAWSTDEDMWKRRTSIICQVGAKGDIDLGLLYDCIDPNMADKEFFIRKAIGWVLREVSKKQPDRIYAWLEPRAGRASGVTVREAVKYLSDAQRDTILAAYRASRHGS
jgi:3-methyladenine DNA glycosylase AlkD